MTRGAPAIDGAARKKPRSATWDGRYWNAEESKSLVIPRKRDAVGAFARAVLPGPYLHGHWAMGQTVFSNLFLLSANFTAVHLGESLFTGNRFASVGRSLPEVSRGWILIYGVLLSLLEHSEGPSKGAGQQEWRLQRLVLTKAFLWATLLMAAAIVLLSVPALSLAALMISAPLNYLCLLGWRYWRRRVADQRNGNRLEKGLNVRKVLIVGAGTAGREVAASLEREHPGGRVVVGFLDESGPLGGDVCGRVDDLARIARAEFVDEIIVAMPQQRELSRRVVLEARRMRLDVTVVPDLFGFEPGPIAMERIGNVTVLALHEEMVPEEALFLKRAADVAISLFGLLAATPLLAALALVIKLDSAGPVLYRAPRVGRKGRRFLCYKLRTMVINANELKAELRSGNERRGPFFKMAADPRVTRVGKFLRRYSLDEIPQLWNVLQGDMSLVGPRPHPLDDVERYQLDDLRRLHVKPGITGLWQVMARRDPSFQRNMALDLEYIERWGLWMDLRILYKTISVVLQGSGA